MADQVIFAVDWWSCLVSCQGCFHFQAILCLCVGSFSVPKNSDRNYFFSPKKAVDNWTYPKDGHLQQNTTGKLHSSLTYVLILTVGSDFGQSVTFEGCCTGRGNPWTAQTEGHPRVPGALAGIQWPLWLLGTCLRPDQLCGCHQSICSQGKCCYESYTTQFCNKIFLCMCDAFGKLRVHYYNNKKLKQIYSEWKKVL